MLGAAKQMAADTDGNFKLWATDSVEAAFSGADYIITSVVKQGAKS